MLLSLHGPKSKLNILFSSFLTTLIYSLFLNLIVSPRGSPFIFISLISVSNASILLFTYAISAISAFVAKLSQMVPTVSALIVTESLHLEWVAANFEASIEPVLDIPILSDV